MQRTPPSNHVTPAAEAMVIWLATRESELVRVRDLSLGGMTVLARPPHAVGEPLVIRFSSCDEPFSCQVSHVRARVGSFAVRFLSLSASQQKWVTSTFRARLGAGPRKNGPQRRRSLVRDLSAVEFANSHAHAILVACARGTSDRTPRLLDEVYGITALGDDALWSNVVIGRDDDCDVHIRHDSISRHHASCERDPNTGSYLLWDHGSRNGTRLDGLRLTAWQPRSLITGCILDFGGAKFMFVSPMDAYEKLTEDASWEDFASPIRIGGRS